jgi:tetratricopeptide (TPR) repeat protein
VIISRDGCHSHCVPKLAKPSPVEFLPDEFVKEDVEAYEALPDEFVVEDEPIVGFAGPSDAPPRPWTPAATAIRPPRHSLSTGDIIRRPRRVPTALLAAALGVAGLVATARLIGSSPPRSAPVAANSSAGSASVHALAVPAEPVAAVAPDAASSGQASLPATPGAPEETSEAIDAKEAKEASQQALELGKVALATSLGERSVALDPTDADSWLILGAAYLQGGDYKNARRCFSSCVKQATGGASRECAAMLR